MAPRISHAVLDPERFRGAIRADSPVAILARGGAFDLYGALVGLPQHPRFAGVGGFE
jgi:hypothetical protein